MNSPNNGKVAILFCGQIRTGIACHPNISKFLDYWSRSGDVFIHTWDVDTIPHHGLLKRNPSLVNEKFPVAQETYDKIKELYKPVDMHIGDFYEDFDSKTCYNKIPWLYSFIQVNQMRKKYEQEHYNGAKYWRVLKIRFDMLFPLGHTLDSEIKYMGGGGKEDFLYTCDIWNVMPKKVEDIMWLASSDTMDVMQEWAEQRLQNANITDRHLLDWQEDCALFMKDKNIPVHGWQYNKLYHYRDLHEQMGIDINDVTAVEELNVLRGL
jgi:hypothetical protein